MNSTQGILLGGTVIILFGFANAVLNNRPKTPVFAGGIGVVLIASLAEALGGQYGAKFAGAILGLAVLTVVLVEGPPLLKAIANPITSSAVSINL